MVVVGLAAGGAAIFVPRVEDDLEARVVEAFNTAGVGPVTISFSGQDGTLHCRSGPVEIPDELVERSRALWGVNSLTVDPSCTATSGSGGVDVVPPSTQPAPDPTTVAAPTTVSPPTEPAADTTTTTIEDTDRVVGVIDNDSQFSTLAGLLDGAGLADVLAGDGSFTVFAPTNEAFQSLGPDAVAALVRDPDLLGVVLRHHAIAATLLAADLGDGEIEMLDGTTVSISADADGIELTSGAAVARVVEADLVAANGVVHAIDEVLVPADVDLDVATTEPLVTAALSDGQLVLLGSVVDDGQRALLAASALSGFAPANVTDELVVDAARAIPDERIVELATLVAAMPTNMVSGAASITGAGITLRGVYVDADALAELEAAAQRIADGDTGTDVLVELVERDTATQDGAAELEAELNELVTANPILFEQNSDEITPESAAIVDRVAALANRVVGISIEVRGHTDTDGTAERNQVLSQGRAGSVRDALIARGVPAFILTATGFGGSQPILDEDGVEDKARSRRVEFVVTTQ